MDPNEGWGVVSPGGGDKQTDVWDSLSRRTIAAIEDNSSARVEISPAAPNQRRSARKYVISGVVAVAVTAGAIVTVSGGSDDGIGETEGRAGLETESPPTLPAATLPPLGAPETTGPAEETTTTTSLFIPATTIETIAPTTEPVSDMTIPGTVPVTAAPAPTETAPPTTAPIPVETAAPETLPAVVPTPHEVLAAAPIDSETFVLPPTIGLGEVADHFGITVDTLARLNGIENPNNVMAGTLLRLRGEPVETSGNSSSGAESNFDCTSEMMGTYATIQPGDSWSSFISRRLSGLGYTSTQITFMINNGILRSYGLSGPIIAGAKACVPNGTAAISVLFGGSLPA